MKRFFVYLSTITNLLACLAGLVFFILGLYFGLIKQEYLRAIIYLLVKLSIDIVEIRRRLS